MDGPVDAPRDGPVVDILMYHSISEAGGPTSIPPVVFREQMGALADSGMPVVSLDDLREARAGGRSLPPRSVVVTFDDAFADFAETAWPSLEAHGFAPVVFVPTGHVGGAEGWRGAASPARRLMGWPTIRALAAAGVRFGSHSVSHPDLARLAPDRLDEELRASRATLEDRLGTAVEHFAPPYGLTTPSVRRRIAAHYQSSVGTRLGRAGPDEDIFDLPRLEMFYFTAPGRWQRHLAGRGAAYLRARRLLRGVRGLLRKPWDRR